MDKTSLVKAIKEKQREWANRQGKSFHTNPKYEDYLDRYEDNLFLGALSEKSKEAFESGTGNELEDRGNGPAKMKSLISSAALVANVFDMWTGSAREDKWPLLSALGLSNSIWRSDEVEISLEKPFPTGLRTPPHLDVALRNSDGHVVGVESKFTEWLEGPKPGFTDEEKSAKSYFEKEDLWEKLPKTRQLAMDLHEGKVSFDHLDVAQLIKHCLGLSKYCLDSSKRFTLLYLFYEPEWEEAEEIRATHRRDISNFASLVDGEFDFQYRSYQQLFKELKSASGVQESYLSYLGERYFSA